MADSDSFKEQAAALEQQAEELKKKAEAEKEEAKARAAEEKAAIDADLDFKISQLKKYGDKRKRSIDEYYGLS